MTLINAHSSPVPLYMQSPFNAELGPSLAVRARGTYSPDLFVALFMTPPDADGVGGVELVDGEYQRQAVDLVPRGYKHLTVPRPILFRMFSCPLIKGIGLVTEDGVIEAYGSLRSARSAQKPTSRIELQSHQMLIRLPDPAANYTVPAPR